MQSSLDLELTRRCNLRCDYCFVGWSRDWTSDLPWEVAAQVVAEGAGRFDLLHLTGGEPFAWRPIFDLIDLGLARGYSGVLINSNGTLLDAPRITRLGAYGGRVALSISLDGPPELHDAVRGPGRHAQAAATVDALIAAGVPVTVMCVVTPPVLAVLPAFLRSLVTTHPGLQGITLFPVGVGAPGTQKPGKDLSSLSTDEIHLLAVHTALAFHAGIPVQVAAWPVINPLLAMLGYPRAMMYQCTAGRGRICVHADQSVSSCHPVKDPIYGRWSPGLFGRLPGFSGHRRLAARDFEGCRSCAHQEACGHCRAFVTASGAPLYGNDEVCLDVVPGRREQAAAPPPADATEAVRALFSLLGQAPADGVLEALVTPDCTDADPMPLQPPGRDGIAFKFAWWRAARPEARSTLEHLELLRSGPAPVVRADWRTEPGPGEPVLRFRGRFELDGARISAVSVEPDAANFAPPPSPLPSPAPTLGA